MHRLNDAPIVRPAGMNTLALPPRDTKALTSHLTDDAFHAAVTQAQKTATEDPSLILGADYSAQGDIGCIAIVHAIGSELDRLDAAFAEIITLHVSRSVVDAELHMKELWNHHARKKGPFAPLDDVRAIERFLLDLAGRASKVCSFGTAVSGHFFPEHKKAAAFSTLLSFGLSRASDLLAVEEGVRVGGCKLLVDRGDGVQLLRPKAKGKGRHATYVLDGGESPALASDPQYLHVDSQDHRLVQLADLAAYAAAKVLASTERLAAAGSDAAVAQRLRKERRFFEKICNVLNLEFYTFIDPSRLDELTQWERLMTAEEDRAPMLELRQRAIARGDGSEENFGLQAPIRQARLRSVPQAGAGWTYQRPQ